MDGPKRAPIYDVPADRVVSIEHPCIVRNFENGIKSLGGDAQLKHVLEHHVGDSKLSGNKQNALPEPVAGVSLRPNDPFAKRIPSTGVQTRNVLVKVTIPKRTGRKRKRGSDEPFTEPTEPQKSNPSITAPDLLQRLQETEGKYSVQPIAILRETHRFRTLPDFQLRSAEIPIMRTIRDHAVEPDYKKIKDFYVDLSPLPHNTAKVFPGPPSFTHLDIPYKYEYQQAATVVVEVDAATGTLVTKNVAAAAKRLTWELPADIEEIPQAPPPNLTPRSPTGDVLSRAIKLLEELLEKRPLVTKRVALNNMPPMSDTAFKEACQYVGYSFKAGPWRDSLIKYGVDPRKDPKYRFYQTMMFQVDHMAFSHDQNLSRNPVKGSTGDRTLWSRTLRHTRDPNTHIFDGKFVTANGKTWQVCDLVDPVLYKILHTSNIRTECDILHWGWYHNATMGKARAIMRDKMRFLFAGETPPPDVYDLLIPLPEELTNENIKEAYLDPRIYGRHASDLSMDVRMIVKNREQVKSKKEGASEVAAGGDGDGRAGSEEIDLREIDVGDGDESEDGGGAGVGDFADVDPKLNADVEMEPPGDGNTQNRSGGSTPSGAENEQAALRAIMGVDVQKTD